MPDLGALIDPFDGTDIVDPPWPFPDGTLGSGDYGGGGHAMAGGTLTFTLGAGPGPIGSWLFSDYLYSHNEGAGDDSFIATEIVDIAPGGSGDIRAGIIAFQQTGLGSGELWVQRLAIGGTPIYHWASGMETGTGDWDPVAMRWLGISFGPTNGTRFWASPDGSVGSWTLLGSAPTQVPTSGDPWSQGLEAFSYGAATGASVEFGGYNTHAATPFDVAPPAPVPTCYVRRLSCAVTFAGEPLADVLGARGDTGAEAEQASWPQGNVFLARKPTTGNEEDFVRIVAGAGSNNVLRGSGRVQEFRASSFPRGVEMAWMGTLGYADGYTPPPTDPEAPEDGIPLDDLMGQQSFTASASTDRLTATAHGYSDGQDVVVFPDDNASTLPAPLAESTRYFVRDATADDFKLAATSGGSAINLTTNGSGTLKVEIAPTGRNCVMRALDLVPELAPASFDFTADAATDVLTAAGHVFRNGEAVTVRAPSGGTIATPLVDGQTYYVRDIVVGDSLKLAATDGGAAVDITAAHDGGTLERGPCYDPADIQGTDTLLGQELPENFALTGTVWAFIRELDKAEIYRTCQGRNLRVFRLRMVGHPDPVEDFTLTNADLLDGTTGNRETRSTRNMVEVEGAGGVKADPPIYGSNDIQGDAASDPKRRYPSKFSSPMIESGTEGGVWDGNYGLRADEQGAFILDDVNKEFVTAQAETWRDDPWGPGRTFLLDAVVRTLVGEKLWLLRYGWEILTNWTATLSGSGGGTQAAFDTTFDATAVEDL